MFRDEEDFVCSQSGVELLERDGAFLVRFWEGRKLRERIIFGYSEAIALYARKVTEADMNYLQEV